MASGAWSVLRTTGDAPTPRGGHTSTLVEKNLLLMGGVVGAKAGTFEYFPLDPLVLNTETLAWFRPRVALGKGPIPRDNLRAFDARAIVNTIGPTVVLPK